MIRLIIKKPCATTFNTPTITHIKIFLYNKIGFLKEILTYSIEY
jgi:hypothetical protein